MRKTLIVIVSIFAFLIGGLFALPHFVDINDYVDTITKEVKKSTGHDVALKGHISFTIVPNISVVLHNVEASFDKEASINQSKKTFGIEKVILSLKLWPLFNGKFQFDSIELVAPKIDYQAPSNTALLAKENAVKSNADDTSLATTPAEITDEEFENLPEVNELSQKHTSPLQSVSIDKLSVTNGTITYRDTEGNTVLSLKNFTLDVGFAYGEPKPFKMSSHVSAPPAIETENILIEGTYLLSQHRNELDKVKITYAQSIAYLSASYDRTAFTPDFNFVLDINTLDITPFITRYREHQDRVAHAEGNIDKITENDDASLQRWSDKAIDFSGLNNVNFDLGLRIKYLIADKYTIKPLDITASLNHGLLIAKIRELNLNEAEFNANLDIDITKKKPHFTLQAHAENADLQKISAKDSSSFVNGIGKASIALQSSGNSPLTIVNALGGSGSVEVEKGKVEDFDLLGMVGNVTKAFNIGRKSSKDTSFNVAKASFIIENGIVKSNDLSLETRLLRFEGEGSASLPDWTVNYRISPVVASVNIAGAEMLSLKTPILIKGPLDNPSIRPVISVPIQSIIGDKEGTKALIKQLKNDLKGTEDSIRDSIKEDPAGTVNKLLKGFGGASDQQQ